MYGISQNPNTKVYIMIFNEDQYLMNCCIKCEKYFTNVRYKWCKACEISQLKENFTNWTSEDEHIDDLIQKMQLGINYYTDIIFEWIPYFQFNNIKELSDTTYLAKWKDGPLSYSYYKNKYTVKFDKPDLSVPLKISGLSGYPLVRKLIRFIEYRAFTSKLRNKANIAVILKYLANSQNVTKEFLNETIEYYDKVRYGISQNPNTMDYIMIFNKDQYLKNCCVKCEKYFTNIEYKWCKQCGINWLKENFANWTSENKQIDNLIQEIQLGINDYYKDVIFEWIPYHQLNNIEKLSSTTYSARWDNGPLLYNPYNKNLYTRNLKNKSVILKYLVNSQNITNEFLNEIIAYYNELSIYGISQNPNTKDYTIVLNYDQHFKILCDTCYDIYTNVKSKWCESCQKCYLKENFTNWTSDNEQIDRLIQEMQLRINDHKDIIFEWIPYNQFNCIKEIGEGGFAKVYSARWRDGPLYWNKKEYTRDLNKTIALKCLNNSQYISTRFLNEVKAYSINNLNNIDNSGEILKIYGISQNPNTKDYVMVLQHARGGSFNNWLNRNYKNFNWPYKLNVLNNIINCLKEMHQKQMVHCDFHTGNILFKDTYYWITSNYISDMGSSGEVDNIDETKIYGVMPYVAPEVLRRSPYTKAADIYSFGMIMYFVATEKQPFANRAHDGLLALDICKGIRPEINELIAPKCYIDLMKKCLDSNPINRPNVAEVEELIKQFYSNNDDQFKEAEEYRLVISNNGVDKNNHLITHPQAFYTSRLLNPFTENLPKYTDDNTDCLDYAI
ncbi:unnamed protein product [Rhizophagus irregularis]|nr:unnamed protein product [Rhizophagus irregularis]